MSRRTGAPSITGGAASPPATATRVDPPPIAPPGYVSKTDMVAALIRQLIITGERWRVIVQESVPLEKL